MPGVFSDVEAGVWYENELKLCWEEHLVDGVGDGKFAPGENITLGEAAAFAARIHNMAYSWLEDREEVDFVQGEPWYQVYVDYDVANGILEAGQYADYGAYATRAQFAAMIARSLPASELTVRNGVEDGAVPDLPQGSPFYDEIYTLYRAGILTGAEDGSFMPDTYISRAETVAILGRVGDYNLRKTVALYKSGVYDFSVRGIAFRLPESLEITETTPVSTELEPREGGGNGIPGILVSCLSGSGDAETDGERAAEMILTLRQGITGPNILEEPVFENVTVAGLPAVRCVYTLRVEGDLAELVGSDTVKSTVTWVYNTDNDKIVALALAESADGEASCAAAFEELLASAAHVPDLTGGGIRPEYREAADRLAALLEEYIAVSGEVGTTFAERFPEVYEELTAFAARRQELEAMRTDPSVPPETYREEYMRFLKEYSACQDKALKLLRDEMPVETEKLADIFNREDAFGAEYQDFLFSEDISPDEYVYLQGILMKLGVDARGLFPGVLF